MEHATPLITTVVVGLGLAFVLAAIATRLRIPVLVGYLVAGIAVGPFTPGFVADSALALELAEIGVILLMFGVGLHFSPRDLLAVSAIAVPGAVAQIAIATAMGLGLAVLMGWTVAAGLVFGLALSVASTVVLLKALQERREVETRRGRIAVGWLIVEDLAMVLALVLLPALAGLAGGTAPAGHDPIAAALGLGLGGVVAVTLAKVAVFVAVMLIVGRRLIPAILHRVAHTGSRELFRLAVLAIALGVAFGAAQLFGVSLALGAFFAGMVLSGSELSQRAAQETLPLRDAFAVLFFVSVGMLFDPSILWREPLPFLAVLFVVLFGKSAAAFAIVRLFGHPTRTALTISASLAQIGEFSFILVGLGVTLGLLPERGRDLVLGAAIVSIMLNPLMFAAVDRLVGPPKSEASGKAPAEPERQEPTGLADHVVLVGHGRVGRLVAEVLWRRAVPFLVVEMSERAVASLRAGGVEVVAGNIARPEVARLAAVERARALVVAVPDAFEAGQAVEQARRLNPAIDIVARAHSDEEVTRLEALGADAVVMGEREIARGLCDHLFAREEGGGDAFAAALATPAGEPDDVRAGGETGADGRPAAGA